MEVKLYKITDDPRKLEKSVGSPIATPSGTVRGTVDILRPEILVTGNQIDCNYAYIEDFGARWYYIEERNIVRDGLTVLNLRVDVLMSWAEYIKKCPAVCARSANTVSAFVNDSRRTQAAFMVSSVKEFAALSYSEPCIIMLTVG